MAEERLIIPVGVRDAPVTLDVVARDCPGSQTRSLGWSTE